MRRRYVILFVALVVALTCVLSSSADSSPIQMRLAKSGPTKLVVMGWPSVYELAPYVFTQDQSGQETPATAAWLDMTVVVPKVLAVSRAWYLGKTSNIKPKVVGNRYSWHVLVFTGQREFFVNVRAVKPASKPVSVTATATISGISKTVTVRTRIVLGKRLPG